MDESLPLFHRAYGWYRCFRHWASLRFDDTTALVPQTLERRTRGVFGLLKKTKTSGADKKVSLLPVWVSQDAWIHKKGWLDAGLVLWTTGPLA